MQSYFKSGSFYVGLGLTALAAFITTQTWAGDPPPADVVAEVEPSDLPEEATPDVKEVELAVVQDSELPADVNLLLSRDGRVSSWRVVTDELAEMDQKTNALVKRARAANQKKDEAQYKVIKEELTQLVQMQFKAIEGRRAQQVADLEERLTTLRNVLKQRTDHAEQIVERRVKTLLGESDALDWNPTPGASDKNVTYRSQPLARNQDFDLAIFDRTISEHQHQAGEHSRKADRALAEAYQRLSGDKSQASQELHAAREQLQTLAKTVADLQQQYEANREMYENARRQMEDYRRALDEKEQATKR